MSPQLVKRMAAKFKAWTDLMHDATDIGPHCKGGAVLVSEIDVTAHTAEVAKLRARVAELEDDLEDVGLVLFLQERLATTAGSRLPTQQFLTAIGMADHIEQLPR